MFTAIYAPLSVFGLFGATNKWQLTRRRSRREGQRVLVAVVAPMHSGSSPGSGEKILSR